MYIKHGIINKKPIIKNKKRNTTFQSNHNVWGMFGEVKVKHIRPPLPVFTEDSDLPHLFL